MIQMVTPYDIKLVFVQKITFVLEKINQQKLLPPKLHFLTPICTKSFVGLQRSPDPLAVFGGPTSKGMGEKRRRGERREGVRPLH